MEFREFFLFTEFLDKIPPEEIAWKDNLAFFTLHDVRYQVDFKLSNFSHLFKDGKYRQGVYVSFAPAADFTHVRTNLGAGNVMSRVITATKQFIEDHHPAVIWWVGNDDKLKRFYQIAFPHFQIPFTLIDDETAVRNDLVSLVKKEFHG